MTLTICFKFKVSMPRFILPHLVTDTRSTIRKYYVSENARLTSLSAVLINAIAKSFEVLRTCVGSVVMATIYVVMFGSSVYECPQCGKRMCTCKSNMQSYVNIQCHLETFQALGTNFGTAFEHVWIWWPWSLVLIILCVSFRSTNVLLLSLLY